MKQFTSTLFMLFACVYLYAQPGTLDAGFNPTGTPGYTITDIDGQNDIVTGMVVKPSDNSIYVTGYIDGADDSLFIMHYLNNGTLDPAFGPGGIKKYQYLNNTTRGNAIGLQSDGTIVVTGWTYVNFHDFFIGRFDPTTGAVLSETVTDVSSGGSSKDEANALIIQNDDKIVVAGLATSLASGNEDMAIARYTAAGLLDNTFNPSPAPTPGYIVQDINAYDKANAIAYDKTSGDVIVAGTSNYTGAAPDFTVLRLSSTGGFVTGFNGTGIKTLDLNSTSADEATAVALDRIGNIVVAGNTSSSNPPNVGLVRFLPNGALDLSFGGTGIVITNFVGSSNDLATSLVIQSDDKIVVGGSTDNDLMLLRYSNAGALDITFGNSNPSPDGKEDAIITGTSENGGQMRLFNNKIYFAGYTSGSSDAVLAVFNNDAVALPLVLSSFYAQKQTNKVVLQWQTSSEEGVKQFVIERSTDGKTYKAIGQVAASGNSSLTKHYSFADQSPYMSTSNYYRLNMQDIDGAIKYSKTLIIKFDGQLTTSMAVFPNPTSNLLQVQLPDGMNGTVGLQVFDLNGRLVKFTNLASDGSALNTTVDVSTLVSGIYILKAQAGNVTLTSRFVKK
jgi:uncharacterized delta-60 repeat protein